MLTWDKRQNIISTGGAVLIGVIVAIILMQLSSNVWISVSTAILVAAAFYALSMRRYFRRLAVGKRTFPTEWKVTLEQKVSYYSRLNSNQKLRFEQDVSIFLEEHTITGIDTVVDDEIRVLVAASAVILIFGHPEWEYRTLPEILIYPRSFDEDFDVTSHPQKRTLAGMVVPRNAIVLAKNELLTAFEPNSPAYHVGLHEFAHALDMGDGAAEGIPADLPGSMVEEWYQLMKDELQRVRHRQSILNPYAGKNTAELFAVAVEYFFQRPQELQAQHAKLYEALCLFFLQDPAGSAFLQ